MFLVVLTAGGSAEAVLPSLGLLPHRLALLPLDAPVAQVLAAQADALVLDARRDLVAAKNCAQLLAAGGVHLPVLAVLDEGGLVALNDQWQVHDFVVTGAGPAELEARLRLLTGPSPAIQPQEAEPLRVGAVTVDEASYSARLQGEPLNLTYKEFELLKFFMRHPGQVFTRAQLLAEVWGYDYYGGTRTVDVHVRRLRSKLGGEHEQLISTVRNVGYSFSVPRGD